ncbi:MAG: hypothetical protein MR279_01560 [Bacteroidales bacterium]|nr:hypothetical protein [Bacteroidales bacterium]MCI6416661.1 hypothetical protein [Bacteroidales bacterium]
MIETYFENRGKKTEENKTEQGWGEYPFDERPQREKRLNAIINHNNKNNETKKDKN